MHISGMTSSCILSVGQINDILHTMPSLTARLIVTSYITKRISDTGGGGSIVTMTVGLVKVEVLHVLHVLTTPLQLPMTNEGRNMANRSEATLDGMSTRATVIAVTIIRAACVLPSLSVMRDIGVAAEGGVCSGTGRRLLNLCFPADPPSSGSLGKVRRTLAACNLFR